MIGRVLLRVRLHPHGYHDLSHLDGLAYVTQSLLYTLGTRTLLATTLFRTSLSVLRPLHSLALVDVASKSLVYSKAVRRL